MDEDALTFWLLAFCVAFFLTGLIWQGLWSILTTMIMSGNLFYEAIEVIAFIFMFIGALVLAYCAFILLIYFIIGAVIFGLPAYLIYMFLGLENSLILAVVIGIAVLIYLIETNTVKVDHYTITLAVRRKYVIKR